MDFVFRNADITENDLEFLKEHVLVDGLSVKHISEDGNSRHVQCVGNRQVLWHGDGRVCDTPVGNVCNQSFNSAPLLPCSSLKSLGTGAIVAIVVVPVVLIAGIIGLLFLRRSRTKTNPYSKS
eukprot:m.42050 g.42050  ORF g.42050 m.42050 type:complete len:123 (+) comp9837_c0_seq1:948-1316(+)